MISLQKSGLENSVGDGGIDGQGVLLKMPNFFDSRLELAQVKGWNKYDSSAPSSFLGIVTQIRLP